MRRAAATIAIAATVVACGGGAAKPSGADAPTTSAPATGAPKTCLAAVTNKTPPGWSQVGTVVVKIEGDKPTTIEIKDSSGKVTSTEPAPKTPKEMREAMRLTTCKAGGYLAVVSGAPPKGATTMTFAVLNPVREDEAGDLASMCKEPAEIPADFDPSPKLAVAAQLFEERLTSAKWRGWLLGLSEELRSADDAARVTIKKTHGAVLADAAKGSCWFATQLTR